MVVTPGPMTNVWAKLDALAQPERRVNLSAAFETDPEREGRFCVSAPWITLDFSRQLINDSVMTALLELVSADAFPAAVDAMFAGESINITENRAAWHVLLRRPRVSSAVGSLAEVLDERIRMLEFAEQIRSEERFEFVVNIGIGGSDLGPRMAVSALSGAGKKIYFVSNVDGCALHDVMEHCAPKRTLFVVCSKTFSTQETLVNAERAKKWIIDSLGTSAVEHHFAGVSANLQAMLDFGLAPQRCFRLWDWVGGRFSIWSSVSLVLAIAIGRAKFEEFLEGAFHMDEHFREAPASRNLPILMAVLGIWNVNFLRIPTLAILPYSSRLSVLPAFLQQLEMESNGKRVDSRGATLSCETAPIVWGASGNDAQHSFFQLLHQGSLRSAVDFVLVRQSPIADAAGQLLANANALAQIEGLAMGFDSGDAQRYHPGSRPASVLIGDRLSAHMLGALIAAYEHKVFIQSLIWGVNPFDQYGVEYGKLVCRDTYAALSSGDVSSLRTIRKLVSKVS